jgi:hypothetical protein
MTFVLTNASALLQTLVNDVLQDMLNRFVLVFSRSAQEHVLHVQQVLQLLLENQLFGKAEKCEFHNPLPGLHHRCRKITDGSRAGESGGGFAPAFYRRFIQSYSTLASPLSALDSPNVRFTWSRAADRAFQDLKHGFTTAPILVHPDPWGMSGPSVLPWTSSYIPAPSSPIALTPQRGTTIWGIVSFSR